MAAKDGDPPAPADRDLVATLVHDLRNPLAALAGNLALLREELGEALADHAGGYLDDCDALVSRALALVGNIVDADALARGTVVARPAPVRIAPALALALTTVAADVEARALVVEQDVPPLLTAAVDPRLLGRVLQCLLDNAVRYAPRAGRVAIRAAAAGPGELVLAIGNSGRALTDDERQFLFEREFRAAERAASARRGRGLGLYFCRVVAEAHGGTITVESRPTLPVEFVLRVPLA
ncbi:MAG: HAMP domain-containing sensor histidine kinase [Kofleriaceae bacterium]